MSDTTTPSQADNVELYPELTISSPHNKQEKQMQQFKKSVSFKDQFQNYNKNQAHVPAHNFTELLRQLSKSESIPTSETSCSSLRNKKINLVLQRKFMGLLQDGAAPITEDKKTLIQSVSSKIACWMDGLIDEAQARSHANRNTQMNTSSHSLHMSSIVGETNATETTADFNEDFFKSVASNSNAMDIGSTSMVSVSGTSLLNEEKEVRIIDHDERKHQSDHDHVSKVKVNQILETLGDVWECYDWMSQALMSFDEWGSWIRTTVANTTEKVEMKNKMQCGGSSGAVPKTDWNDWNEEVKLKASLLMKKNKCIQDMASMWTKKSGVAKKKKLETVKEEASCKSKGAKSPGKKGMIKQGVALKKVTASDSIKNTANTRRVPKVAIPTTTSIRSTAPNSTLKTTLMNKNKPKAAQKVTQKVTSNSNSNNLCIKKPVSKCVSKESIPIKLMLLRNQLKSFCPTPANSKSCMLPQIQKIINKMCLSTK